MKPETLNFPFQARYFKSGEITEKTDQVWYVLHGYGQLAQYFLKKFEVLQDRNICIIAPEGLSRFYLADLETRSKGGNDRVGATWMTRENREMDIANYLNYLNAIHKKEVGESKIPVTLFGFSQGAATASRWALKGNADFERLILWAGLFPPDMDFEVGHKILKSKEVITVLGNQDPFITPERLGELNSLSAKLGIKPKVIRFEGGHDIDRGTLLALLQ